MAKIDSNGYITSGVRMGNSCGKSSFRNWWLVKWSSGGSGGLIRLSTIHLPPSYVGKKVRFKIEIEEED